MHRSQSNLTGFSNNYSHVIPESNVDTTGINMDYLTKYNLPKHGVILTRNEFENEARTESRDSVFTRENCAKFDRLLFRFESKYLVQNTMLST